LWLTNASAAVLHHREPTSHQASELRIDEPSGLSAARPASDASTLLLGVRGVSGFAVSQSNHFTPPKLHTKRTRVPPVAWRSPTWRRYARACHRDDNEPPA